METLTLPPVQRVAIIDDNPEARITLAEAIKDANMAPVIQATKITSLEEFLEIIPQQANAAICDHRLSPGNYASFKGAEAVARLNAQHFPALLVTDWSKQDLNEIRLYRGKIPVMIKGRIFGREDIAAGIKVCSDEFNKVFTKERKPWRSLIRIIAIEDQMVSVIVPSWNPNVSIKLLRGIFPKNVGSIQVGSRFFARVNTGAPNDADLYFEDFEIAETPTGEYAKTILT